MDALLVDGDEIELTPDPPWQWTAPVRLSVTALPGHLTKADGKFAVWQTEIVQAGLLAAGKMYLAPGFATPGAVITCNLIVNPATLSQVHKDLTLPLATVATSGTFIAAMAPAMNPSGVPDPVLVKTGTWRVATEKQSVAKSAQPKPAATDGEEGDVKAAAASGSNSVDAGPVENKVHWVGVKYQDVDGNPLPDHRIAINTPDGRRVERKTTAAGASRVDGVRAEGEAIASLLEVSLRPGVKQPVVPFLGVTIVDEDGLPIEGLGLGFTSPAGAELTRETNNKGSVRLDRLPELGTWTVKAKAFADGIIDGPGDGSGDDVGTGIGDGDTGSSGEHEPAKRFHLLEIPDVLCRTSSCVIMPEGEAPSGSTEHPAISGVDIFAIALRQFEERPEFQLFIAAHTDTVDTTEDNQLLSDDRAKMAQAILTGDRASYASLAHARHRVSDIKQMLHWCVTAFPDVFTCDPGVIDDRDNLWTPVHTFESEFNYFKHYFQASQTEDLELTGSMGPKNWGALFDVIQFGIAQELGLKVQEVGDLRKKITWLKEGREALGFSEHHPIDAVGRDNYASQSNRRVELLFFDKNDILPDLEIAKSNPAGSEIYIPDIYERIVLVGSGVSAKRPEFVLAVPSFFSRESFFPKPSGFPAALAVRKFLTEHPEMTAIVVGHSDGQGDLANKELATQRAEAFRALVLGDVAFFEGRVLDPWGIEEMQWMLHVIEVAKSPCYAGLADGFVGPRTEAAIGLFQAATSDLPISYEPTDATRQRLAKRYTESLLPAPEFAERVKFIGVAETKPPRPDRTSGVHAHLDRDHAVYRRRVDVFFCSKEVDGRMTDLENTPQLFEGWAGSAALASELQLREVPVQVFGVFDAPLGETAVELASVDEQGLSFSGQTDENGFLRLPLQPGAYEVKAGDLQGEATFGPDTDCGVNIYFDANQSTISASQGSESS